MEESLADTVEFSYFLFVRICHAGHEKKGTLSQNMHLIKQGVIFLLAWQLSGASFINKDQIKIRNAHEYLFIILLHIFCK